MRFSVTVDISEVGLRINTARIATLNSALRYATIPSGKEAPEEKLTRFSSIDTSNLTGKDTNLARTN